MNFPNSSPNMQPSRQSPKVTWDEKELSTSFANVCNVSCSGDDVTLLFGLSEPGLTEGEMRVRLTECIHLSPPVARQLAKASQTVLSEYDKRFGTFKG